MTKLADVSHNETSAGTKRPDRDAPTTLLLAHRPKRSRLSRYGPTAGMAAGNPAELTERPVTLMDAPATVTQALPLRLIDGSGARLELTAELRYDAADPYAVDIVFHTGDPRGVRWVFARDLLAEGLFRRTGDGDVRVSPHLDDRGTRIVQIELRSPDGEAVLQAPADGLRGFLESTYAVVLPGSESAHIDLDMLVEALRGSDPRPF